MKKKKLILPSVILAVSVVLIAVMLVFTTDFLFYFRLNGSNKNNKGILDVRKVSDFAYKVNPTYSNLLACKGCYSYQIYFDADDLDSSYPNSVNMPKEFYAKGAEYAEKVYNYHLTHKDAYRGPKENSNFDPWGVAYLSYGQALAGNYSEYIVSLYLSGEKEKSRKLVDEFVNGYKENPNIDASSRSIYLHDYVNTLHRLEKDRDYQEWIVEIEKKCTKLYYESNPDAIEKVENMFVRDEDYYIPFDWQK